MYAGRPLLCFFSEKNQEKNEKPKMGERRRSYGEGRKEGHQRKEKEERERGT